MGWFNWIGLVFIVVIMLPNVIYFLNVKDKREFIFNNKYIETLEQIGRYGCFVFMIFNIPFTYFGFFFESAFFVYVLVNCILVALYVLFWILLWNKNGLLKAISFSVLPSLIFLFSSVMLSSIFLLTSAIIFAPCHIYISCVNRNNL